LKMIDLSRKKLFLFDLDGVLTAGKESPVKLGGTKVINKIRSKRGKRFFVLTNDSTDTSTKRSSPARSSPRNTSRRGTPGGRISS
jgi:ribonucleotide monophosphatase NagD (HAD superfamily)